MSTTTRKQREIFERESRILDISRPMLIRQGYHGLNMDRIADALQYSKGTIYNHFSCKEEIIIALAIQTMEKRSELFRRASAFRGRSRERMTAIGYASDLFVRLYPEHFQVEQIIGSASIWEKTSEKRRVTMRTCEQRCIDLLAGIVLDGVAQGDLDLPSDITPEDLVFGLWSQTLGAYSIIATTDSLPELGVKDPLRALRNNIHVMLDGFGWRPLRSELDYESVRARVESEIFPDESRQQATK